MDTNEEFYISGCNKNNTTEEKIRNLIFTDTILNGIFHCDLIKEDEQSFTIYDDLSTNPEEYTFYECDGKYIGQNNVKKFIKEV